MDRRDREDVVRRVLGAFADLATIAPRPRQHLLEPNDIAWLTRTATAFYDRSRQLPIVPALHGDVLATARLRGDEVSLRVGFLWVANGGRYFPPLVSVPVRSTPRLLASIVGDAWFADGEPELWDPTLPEAERLAWLHRLERAHVVHDDLEEPPSRAALKKLPELDELARDFARRLGVTRVRLRPAERDPSSMAIREPNVVVAAFALYADAVRAPSITNETTFRAWAARPLRETALAALYAPLDDAARADDHPADPADDHLDLAPLDSAQRAAVDAVGDGRPVTVISGPPGTGKSHAVAAIANAAVARGEHVLIAAPSDAAVHAVAAILQRTGGPVPVVFGGGDGERAELADRFADASGGNGLHRRRRHGSNDPAGALEDDRRTAIERYRSMRGAIEDQLAAETVVEGARDDELLARADAPGCFDLDADHERIGALLTTIERADGWWSRRRARRARRELHDATRAGPEASTVAIRTALRVARRVRRAAELRDAGGLSLEEHWPTLLAAEDRARAAGAAWLAHQASHPDRLARGGSEAVAVVGSALRSGRARRRALLASVPGDRLTKALPVWIATLGDIEDLLPATPGMFDLTIIDEAAQVDQPTAAVALARARRAVIVGDPRQLRHVSFLKDDRVRAVLTDAGLADDPLLAGRLDLRRMTVFDAAAAVAPVHLLSVHHRSAPHLIAFSAARFYEGRLSVATAHPSNDAADRIDIVEVDGERANGVNQAEIDAVVRLLRQALDSGATSLGVVTPFRAQADAIRRAALPALKFRGIAALDLRVGTVHGFQGCERDHVIISLAASGESDVGFLNDRHLFNVMVTRARERITVVSSLGDRATGLAAEYLRHAAGPDGSVTSRRAARGWNARVEAELRRAGIPVVAHYPFGDTDLDLVVGDGADAIAVECTVHPDGPAEHVDRHLALMRRGWRVTDAFASRWDGRPAELAVRLAVEARPR